MFGFFNLRKPAGPTSHDMVSAVRRLLPRGTRVGHAGTLDPFADGVLVICVGPAARLAEFVQAAPKRYRAVVTLGATSTTDDPEGEILPREPAPPPSPQDVRQAVARFVGEIPQTPPAHSAVLVNGHRAYKLARAGRELNLRPRVVAIHAIDVIRYDWPRLTLDVR
ncbi:MAG TPA: tRNA pseudouridine(55) synthase TruB, partial [Phycisphaerae bacterium]|nr:tRNA pseudouridine(55) synthase TruB [Phycisphaerae bacterium]